MNMNDVDLLTARQGKTNKIMTAITYSIVLFFCC